MTANVSQPNQKCFLLLQIEAVADACIQFFLQPDQLSAQQLVELYQTCYLTTPETQKQALQLLVNMPWTDEVYDALCEVFTELIQQPKLCKELLLSEGCGNMCGMQVRAGHVCLSACLSVCLSYVGLAGCAAYGGC